MFKQREIAYNMLFSHDFTGLCDIFILSGFDLEIRWVSGEILILSSGDLQISGFWGKIRDTFGYKDAIMVVRLWSDSVEGDHVFR